MPLGKNLLAIATEVAYRSGPDTRSAPVWRATASEITAVPPMTVRAAEGLVVR